MLTTYIAKRLAIGLLTLGVAAVAIFSAGFLVPGDPVVAMLGEAAHDPVMVARVRQQYGLDLPYPVQCYRFLAGLCRGDFGLSYFRVGRPVAEIMRRGFPVTARLAVSALGLAVAAGIPLGVSAAVRHNTWVDTLCMFFAVVGISAPAFAVAAISVLVFSIRLGWLPVAGTSTPLHYVLPVLILALSPTATIARLTRATLLENLQQDYVRTARAKGLAERSVIYRHALRNSMIPVITVAGISFGYLLGGSFVVESCFNMPGLGWYGVQAIFQRDYPVIRGVAILCTAVFLVVNLVIDMVYAVLDPRVRLD